MEFKVGDIIKGKANGFEGIKKAKVLHVFGKKMQIGIKEYEYEYEFKQGETYIVYNSMEDFELIEAKKFTKSDLKDGDIVTLRNRVKYRKSGNTIQTACAIISLENFTENLKDSTNSNEDTDIIKVERPVKYETVYERNEEEILNRNEKKYLKAVIKPFRNKIKYIQKAKIFMENEAYIEIATKDDDTACLPSFDQDKMYKGMELCKKYTLEELRL